MMIDDIIKPMNNDIKESLQVDMITLCSLNRGFNGYMPVFSKDNAFHVFLLISSFIGIIEIDYSLNSIIKTIQKYM